MRHTPFPRSGEPVSKLGFGAMGFAGWFGEAKESDWIDSLLYALDQGVSFVDTARAYGDSERIVGEALRKWTGKRPFVASKVEQLAGQRGWGTPVDPEHAHRRNRPVPIVAVSDPELVAGQFDGDHAGRYEISQLMYLRPELVDLGRLDDRHTTALGRFAQGDDAGEATEREGQAIIEASLDAIKGLVAECQPLPDAADVPFMSLEEADEIWQRVADRSAEWCTLRP